VSFATPEEQALARLQLQYGVRTARRLYDRRTIKTVPEPDEEESAARSQRGRANVNSHKQFMGKIVTLAKARGWIVHYVHDSRHSPAGKLDLTLRRPAGWRPQWPARWIEAEVKSGAAILTRDPDKHWDQEREIAFLVENFPMVEVRVWREVDDLEEIIADLSRWNGNHGYPPIPSGSGPGTAAWEQMIKRRRRPG
jgi:hypothetical protein